MALDLFLLGQVFKIAVQERLCYNQPYYKSSGDYYEWVRD